MLTGEKSNIQIENPIDFFYPLQYRTIFNRKGNVYPLQVDMGKIGKNRLNRFIGKGGSPGKAEY